MTDKDINNINCTSVSNTIPSSSSKDSNEVNMSKIEYLKKVKTEKEIPLEIVEIIDSLEFETRLNDEETKFLFNEDDKCDIN